MIKLTAALLISATVTMTATADPITPSQTEDLLESYGATVHESAPAGSDSYIIDAKLANDLNFSMRLGNCDDADACSYAMMFSTFDLGSEAQLSEYIKANHYNDSYPFGRAFIVADEDSPGNDVAGIDYGIDLSGETRLDANDIGRFEQIVSSFIDHWTSSDGE